MQSIFLIYIIVLSSIIINLFLFGLFSLHTFLYIKPNWKIQEIKQKNEEKENFTVNDTYLSCSSSCIDEIKIITDILHYPLKTFNVSNSSAVIINPNVNNNQNVIDNLMERIASQIFARGLFYIRSDNQSNFLIFYEKPFFMGKMFFIKARSFTWKLPSVSVSSSKKDLDREIQTQIDNQNVSSEINHTSFDTFIKMFEFFPGRHFSCKIPSPFILKMIPLQREGIQSSPIDIKSGNHESLFYNRSHVKEIHMYTQN